MQFLDRNLKWFNRMPNYLHARQLLLELFETEYEIFDHKSTTNPLAAVKFNEGEKFNDHLLLDSYIDLFLYKKVNKYLGLTFDQFIDRPRYEIDKLVTAIERIMVSEANAQQNTLNDLDKANKAGK